MRTEFLNYFEASLRTPTKRTWNFADLMTFVFAYVLVGFSFVYGLSALNFAALASSFCCSSVFAAALSYSKLTDNSPNLVSVMPIAPRKSLLYKFLSVLVFFVMRLLVIVLFLLAVGLITFAIMLIIEAASGNLGNLSDGGEVAEEVRTVLPMGVYGGIFAAAYFVCMYSAGMIWGFIKNYKIKLVFEVGVLAAVIVAMKLMENPFVMESYGKMSLPWLCATLCCVVAAAALGTAIYMGIKRNKKYY